MSVIYRPLFCTLLCPAPSTGALSVDGRRLSLSLPVTYLALGRELTEYQAENWQKEAMTRVTRS